MLTKRPPSVDSGLAGIAVAGTLLAPATGPLLRHLLDGLTQKRKLKREAEEEARTLVKKVADQTSNLKTWTQMTEVKISLPPQDPGFNSHSFTLLTGQTDASIRLAALNWTEARSELHELTLLTGQLLIEFNADSRITDETIVKLVDKTADLMKATQEGR